MAEVLVLAGAAVLAGAMNAIAGGGTILTFPALLAFGMPAVEANATSTVALLVGVIGSAYGYRAHLPAASLWIRRFGLVSVVGGFLGALLLTRTPADIFEKQVPFLLLFATALFMMQSAFNRLARADSAAPSRHRLASIALQFLVALYGGYFGAGIGILMLAVFGLMGLQDIHEMNTLKTVLSALINLVASLYFAFSGLVDWPRAWVMIIASLLGYFAGARLTQQISRERVRQLVTAIGLGISLVMFWKEFS
jgi:uncharacterized protein